MILRQTPHLVFRDQEWNVTEVKMLKFNSAYRLEFDRLHREWATHQKDGGNYSDLQVIGGPYPDGQMTISLNTKSDFLRYLTEKEFSYDVVL